MRPFGGALPGEMAFFLLGVKEGSEGVETTSPSCGNVSSWGTPGLVTEFFALCPQPHSSVYETMVDKASEHTQAQAALAHITPEI